MSIEAVGTSTSASPQSTLTQQDFLKVLTTQLTFQDPLKPMDNQAFMAQMAQFTSLEQTQELNTNIETLIGNQSALQSVGLIGRTVDLTTSSGAVTGSVTALSLSGSSPSITVQTTGGQTLAGIGLGQITAVH